MERPTCFGGRGLLLMGVRVARKELNPVKTCAVWDLGCGLAGLGTYNHKP